jgi:hypothetical protein
LAQSSSFEKLLEQHRIGLSDLRNKSATWFDTRAKDLLTSNKNLRAENLMRGGKRVSNIIPGDMVMFIYDAKHKATLPYWDRFPLVFPFKTVQDGFYGINLHYLPYVMRARLLDRLMVLSNDIRLTDSTRLKLSWQTLQGFSQFKPAQVCVKHYLYEQVKTPFKKVHAQDWATVVTLPTEQFQNQGKQAVWLDSKRTIRGL